VDFAMTQIAGLSGLRPVPDAVTAVTVPPYDVIKPGSALEANLQGRPSSLWHVTLGNDPLAALARLRGGALVEDAEPCFYVYEQRWGGQRRLGVFAAVEVTPYAQAQVIRHEKVFDDKVQGRLALTRQTGLTLEPVFLLTRSAITPVLEAVAAVAAPLYGFTSDFAGHSELHGIANRFWRVPEASDHGRQLAALVARNPLYIADGHHRYHAALLGGQSHCMAYVVEQAAIQAYNRVVNGVVRFADLRAKLALEPLPGFITPPKNAFCLYSGGQAWLLRARSVPSDVVGRLDCSILERELYPLLGLEHRMIKDPHHFDYYPEQDLAKMRQVVDQGAYDLAIALHPVSIDELIAVANAGMTNPDIVMPEKSTFFAPKILSGIMLYRHRAR
jgi:uncharacterized protein (DUF1015 family)